jgi:hypothetical protein
MSPIQQQWLDYLTRNGESEWARMPKLRNGRSASRLVWQAMIREGLIETEYRDGKRWFRLATA